MLKRKILIGAMLSLILFVTCACGSGDVVGKWYEEGSDDPELELTEEGICLYGEGYSFEYRVEDDTVFVDAGFQTLSFNIGAKDGKTVLIDPTKSEDSIYRYLYSEEDIGAINEAHEASRQAEEEAEAKGLEKEQQQQTAKCEEFANYLKETLIGNWKAEDEWRGGTYEFKQDFSVKMVHESTNGNTPFSSTWSVKVETDDEGWPSVQARIEGVDSLEYTDDEWEFQPDELEEAKELLDSGTLDEVNNHDGGLVLLRQ